MQALRSLPREDWSVSDTISITIDGPQLRETVDRLETTGNFAVDVVNHGRATHVHLALDGELAEVTAIPEPNQFVDSEEHLEIPIRLDTDTRPLEGALTVATGYGADETRIPVVVDDTATPVAEPARRSGADSGTAGRLDRLLPTITRDTAAFVAVVVAALALAGLAVTLTQSSVVLLGALLVIASVATGLCYLLFV
jgi:hypothetical protein